MRLGLRIVVPAILICRCPPKRSIGASSSKRALKRGPVKPLRRQHHFRHARASARLRPRPGQILDAVSIRQRPAEVRDRALPGHWEGDLLEGARGTYLATLVERQSRYVMLVR